MQKPGISTHATPRGTPVRWLKWSIALSAIVPTAFFFAIAWITYHDTLDGATARLERTARVAEQHISRVLETNIVLGRYLQTMLEHLDPQSVRTAEQAIHEQLHSLTHGLDQIHSVWVWDAAGAPLVSNRVYPVPGDLSVADRGYFAWARDGGRGWYVSEPLVSRVTGEAFFDTTTVWLTDQGVFAGAISISLFPKYFAAFYERLAAAEGGLAIALVRSDGAFIARYPDIASGAKVLLPTSPLMPHLRSGSPGGHVVGTSSADGQVRHASYRQVANQPLYVVASIAERTLLAGWLQALSVLAAITFSLALLLVYLSWFALQRTRAQLEAFERLRVEADHRVIAEETLRRAQKLEAMGRVTGGVAHDFNNLLMVIGTNLHLLTKLHRELTDSKQVAAMKRAVDAGAGLTRQLLTFSRRQALRPEVLVLQDVLPGLADLLRTTTGSRVALAISVAPDTRPICVDPAEFELALMNLAVNARDAMPGGGKLTITAANGPQREREYVIVRVADTGHGIPPEIRDRVFEPFYTTKPLGEGTGLGLSQVYGFCEQSQGRVELDSTQGVGTTVLLHLPAAAVQAGDATVAARDDSGALPGRLLFVEDNAEVATATMAVLDAFGCETTLARSADEAIALFSEGNRYDAVLTDVVMPGSMDGLALAAWLREDHPEVAVVIMTGYAGEIAKAQRDGYEVLPKPSSPETIAAALRKAFGARHAPD